MTSAWVRSDEMRFWTRGPKKIRYDLRLSATILVVCCLTSRSTTRVPALRTGRKLNGLQSRQNRRRAAQGARIDRTQMGNHLHHACYFRRSVLRLVPVVLQHQFRRSLLAVDDNPLLVRAASRQLRVPAEERQPFGYAHLPLVPHSQRHRGSDAPWRRRRHFLQRLQLHRGEGFAHRHRCARHQPLGECFGRTRRPVRPVEPHIRTRRDVPRTHTRHALYHEQRG